MATMNSKARQPRKKGTNQCKEMKGTAYNIKINRIYPMRKNAAPMICMSQHGLKRKCMAAMIRKSKQPINKRHGTMQGDQRHSFKSQFTTFTQKGNTRPLLLACHSTAPNRKCMAAMIRRAK